MKLFTIGYEGLTTTSFFDLLQQHEVEEIVDVRELPLSRKRGFSKSALSTAAAQHNISYSHYKELGCPRDIRHQYRLDKSWER